jgi:hypothetical protein
MKKRALLFAALIVLVTGFAAAQTDTASITLIGTVTPYVNVTISPASGYDSLDLLIDVTDLTVATVNEYSNVAAGYTVTLESAFATANGSDAALTDGTNSLDYSVTYGGTSVSFSGASATVTDTFGPSASPAGSDKDLAISYSGTAVTLPDGSYSDTLTFTITGK